MKKILIFLSFLLLSGCTVDYNLVYENDILSENVKLQSFKEEKCGENLCSYYYDSFYNSNVSINYLDDAEELATEINLEKYKFYNKKIIDENNFYGIELGYNYETDYENSYVVHRLFEGLLISDYSLQAYDIIDVFSNYPYLENINITFKSDKKIRESNADKVENGIYYWNINKNNYNDKDLYVYFDREQVKKMKDNNNFAWNIIYSILGGLGVIVLFGILIISKKVQKSNK